MTDHASTKPSAPVGAPKRNLDALIQLDRRGLDRVMREGHPIDVDAIVGTRFDGVSLNLPHWLERLTWKKFAKVFHRDDDGTTRGWNCRIVQSPLDAPWELQRKRGEPITYGHYRVLDAAGYRDSMPRPYGHGLMLDYGLGHNGRFDPTARVRDPIVAVNAGDNDLLLGWTYVDLGLKRLATPSYFALRRGVALDHDATPPGAR